MSAIERVEELGVALEPAMRHDDRVRVLGFVGCLVVLVGFWLPVGPLGVGLGLGVLVAWVALGTPVAIAVGHVFLAPVFPETLEALLVVEVGFVVLVLAPVISGRRLGRGVVRVVLALSLLGGLLWGSLAVVPLWVVPLVLLAAVGLASYGLHRLAWLRLGKIEGVDP